jgi:hypothetical protein
MKKLKPAPKIVLLNTDIPKIVRQTATGIIIQVLYVSASPDYSFSPSM